MAVRAGREEQAESSVSASKAVSFRTGMLTGLNRRWEAELARVVAGMRQTARAGVAILIFGLTNCVPGSNAGKYRNENNQERRSLLATMQVPALRGERS
jgi:hypothetical protein